MIDWQSEKSEVFLNPRMPRWQAQLLKDVQSRVPDLRGEIWISTSGSTTLKSIKLIALKKSAFLASAQSVNRHINSTSEDIWYKALPNFHVGGLSQHARAFLSGAKVIESNAMVWNPNNFVSAFKKENPTIVSLVPAQVYDLVQCQIIAPDSLRVVFVGGGALSEKIYRKAIQLGWPIVVTYGMTECCSQIATSCLKDIGASAIPPAKLLDHIQVRKDFTEGPLELSSPSLFSGIFVIEESGRSEYHPRQGQWWVASDIVRIQGETLQFIGRQDQVIKILGEQINLGQLQTRLNELMLQMGYPDGLAVFSLVQEPRKGYEIELVLSKSIIFAEENIMNAVKTEFASIEQPIRLYYVDDIPMTATRKIIHPELKAIIGRTN